MNKLPKIFGSLILVSLFFGYFHSCTSATSLVITADSLNMTNPNIVLKDSLSFKPQKN